MALDAGDCGFHFAESEMSSQQRSSVALSARDRLVVALDKPDVAEAQSLVDKLGNTAGVYKIGLELVMNGGLDLASRLRDSHKVFLDMKFLDIGNTVEKAVANVARQEFNFLTVHGINRKTLDAAVNGRAKGEARKGRDQLQLLAVTVLTSFNQQDLAEEGVDLKSPLQVAVHRAKMAKAAGFDGVIASGHEAKAIREATDSDFIIKVPGIRLSGQQNNDQTRAMTPAEALRNFATYLVVGRPISESRDPRATAEEFIREMNAALTN